MSGHNQRDCICQQRSNEVKSKKLICWDDTESVTDGLTAKDVVNQVINYYNKGNPEAILAMLTPCHECRNNGSERRTWDPLLLWVKPSLCCLQFLASNVREADVGAVASVGCGTGLLEWLLQATTASSPALAGDDAVHDAQIANGPHKSSRQSSCNVTKYINSFGNTVR
ncbi:hypothetical protein SK128_001474 [Halocaridina rubra]|uniref:Uncharacterized protein n=1 Tax=Halocaridina rubra TaxID=373956 RepID=A0AAN8ZYT1_HALRR